MNLPPEIDFVFKYFWAIIILTTLGLVYKSWLLIRSEVRSDKSKLEQYRRFLMHASVWLNLPWVLMGAGILTGEVSSLLDFLKPSEGNSFVTLWFICIGVLFLIGTYWVFFLKGAETLERNSGILMIPRWSASNLRLFWILALLWNAGIVALLYFNAFGLATGSPALINFESAWFPAVFPLFFVAIWLFVCFILAHLGGWHALSKRFAASREFNGRTYQFQSAMMNLASYNRCLTVGSNSLGLYISILFPFRFQHRSLLIPWSEIKAKEVKNFFSRGIQLEFPAVPGSRITLSKSLVENLLQQPGAKLEIDRA